MNDLPCTGRGGKAPATATSSIALVGRGLGRARGRATFNARIKPVRGAFQGIPAAPLLIDLPSRGIGLELRERAGGCGLGVSANAGWK